MAASDAKFWPIKGTAQRIPCTFRDTSGNLITGWTSAAANAYPDNGGAISCVITEAPASSGIGYIDVPSSATNCTMVTVKATVGNSNSTAFVMAVPLLNMAQFTGRWDAQPTLCFEQFLKDIAYLVGANGTQMTGSALNYMNEDGSQHFGASVVQASYAGTVSKPT